MKVWQKMRFCQGTMGDFWGSPPSKHIEIEENVLLLKIVSIVFVDKS